MNTPWELIDAFLDGELTPTHEAELREWLSADREHLRAFVRATHLHQSLRTEHLAQKVLSLESAAGRKDSVGLGSTRASRVVAGAPPATPERSSPRDRMIHVDALKPSGEGAGRHTRERVRSPYSAATSIRKRGTILALAASLVVLIGLSVWLFPPVNNQPTLAIAMGTRVTIERGGQSLPARDGLKLSPGDVLRVSGSNGAAIGYGNENTRVTLDDDTELRTLAWRKGKHFELRQGKLEAVVARQRPFGPMVLLTTQAEARVLGTKFTLAAATNATRLEVTEGKVKLTRTSDGAAVQVGAGNYAVVATNYELASLPFTGGIYREYWTNMIGRTLLDLISNSKYPDRPDGSDYLTNLSGFELPSNQGDNYGERLRGYLHPPTTGDYTFWIAARSDAALWLSWDDNPNNKFHMAHCQGAAPADWEAAVMQRSAALPLVAGERYYFEVLHKAGVGDDNLALAWQGPGREREVIPMKFVSPPESRTKDNKR